MTSDSLAPTSGHPDTCDGPLCEREPAYHYPVRNKVGSWSEFYCWECHRRLQDPSVDELEPPETVGSVSRIPVSPPFAGGRDQGVVG